MVTTRRTQGERTAATRRVLLDATVACLVEHGYHGTTTTRVVERAGTSRGAQVHHFPTKNDLVLAAVRHLADKQTEAFMTSGIAALQASEDWVGEALDLIWEVHQGPLFDASIELWVAARTDPKLREQVAAFERRVNETIVELCRTFIGDRADDRQVLDDLSVVMETVRGLRLLAFVHPAEQGSLNRRWERSKTRLRRMLTNWPSDAPLQRPGDASA
ncbi:TetR/AcrR family transcriptional regulator [Thermomonospora umbrina]|uniref:TetR family transcriptional regulator n=1 Tax=Thermomonospora umbrina TaxID=111806 RepID=A0A3D9STR2_9ACTN|nr:TetR/AcrR family transcriptional regulator [Thermomonospora umbrina]REE97880.1 TetR family transcriptional regulator [Thermomonospora umbrina]